MAFIPYNPAGGSGGGGGPISANDVTETTTRVFVTPSERDVLRTTPNDGELYGLKDDVWTLIPIATESVVGLVKPSDRLTVAADGTMSARIASDTDLGLVKIGSTMTVDANGVLDTQIVAAEKLAVPNLAARLALPVITNLYIVTQTDVNQIFYLNANLNPSIEANWQAGESTVDVVTGFKGIQSASPRTGIVETIKGDYLLSMVPAIDTVTASEYTFGVKNGEAGIFDAGGVFSGFGGGGTFVPLIKAGTNPSNGLEVTSADTVTVFQSTNNGTSGQFAYSPLDNRLTLSTSPLAVATSNAQILAKYDGDRLYLPLPQLNGTVNAGSTSNYYGSMYTGTTYAGQISARTGSSIQFTSDIVWSTGNNRQVGTQGLPAANVWTTNARTNVIQAISGSDVQLNGNMTFNANGTRTIGSNSQAASQMWTSQMYADTWYPRSTGGFVYTSTHLVPLTANVYDLGKSNLAFRYFYGLGAVSYGSNLYLGNINNPNLVYMSGGGSLRPEDEAIGAADLGSSSNRWRTLFCTTNPNVSSDEDLKQDIAKIPESLLDVWFEHVQPCQYQLKDKQDGLHIGVIAQDVIAAFDAAGLDWHDYHVVYENQELIQGDFTEEDAARHDYYSVNYAAVQLIEAMAIRRKLSVKPSKRFKVRGFFSKLWNGWGK